MRALAIALVMAALAGCGAGGAGDDTPVCHVAVQFTPTDALAPGTVTARAVVTGGSGILDYQWEVTRGSTAIPTTPRTPSGSDVDFPADQAGVYHVVLTIPTCEQWSGDKNVRDPGANTRTLRLRFTPAPETALPMQERIIAIPGGADYAAGVLALDGGLPTPVVVRDGGGAIVPAYVRLSSRTTPDVFVELVTDAAGTDTVRLLPGHVDALIVPLSAALAPRRIDDWDPIAGALTVDAGQVATGVVLDPGGAPLAGARVSLSAEGAGTPSTIATTAADGSFAVRWRVPAGGALTVVPPRASGLPRLTMPLVDVQLDRALTVAYASTLVVRDLTGLAVAIEGAAAVGGHAAFAIDVPGAATIGDGVSTQTADGKHRDVVAIDGTGHLTAYRAVGAAGRAYLQGASGPGAVALFDLGTGVPTSLDGGAPAPTTLAIVDEGGQPIRDAQLRALVTGDLAHLAAAAPQATADATGHATLALAPGATYQLDVVDPRHAHAGARVVIAAGSTPAPIALPDAIAITGELREVAQSVGLPGAGVTALCYACSGPERSHPLGEAVTDAAGGFAVVIADPGTGP